METPVGWIRILGLALRTHDKAAHRCVRTVIRNVLNDGEAGAAMGAIQEGVAEAAIAWIEQLDETLITD
jgi:hypothetical protein